MQQSPSPLKTTLPSLEPGPWIEGRKLNEAARARLFCLPYAGGAAANYLQWSRHLLQDIEICPVQYPGRGARLEESPMTHWHEVMEAMFDSVQCLFTKPTYIFGHSLGGVLAFELARRLRREGYPAPLALIVAACPAPQVKKYSRNAQIKWSDAELVAQMRRIGGTPPEVLENQEIMELLLPVLQADMAVWFSYEYLEEEPLECPILTLGGQEDTEVQPLELEAWEGQTHSDFRLKYFPGGHFFDQNSFGELMDFLKHEIQGE